MKTTLALTDRKSFRQIVWRLIFVWIVGLAFSDIATAENDGVSDLDEANLIKLRANSQEDLEKVISLCKSAIEKGLDDESKEYATLLLTATLHERATRLSQLIFKRPPDNRWPVLRRFAMRDLREALQFNDEIADVHLLIARLQSLEAGDREEAEQAIARTFDLLEADDKITLSVAHVVQGNLLDDDKEKLEHFDAAIELNEVNEEAYRSRAITRANTGDLDNAIADFNKLLELSPTDVGAHHALAQIFTRRNDFDQAIDHLDRAIAKGGNTPLVFLLKAEILENKSDLKGAAETLAKAATEHPNSLEVRISLSRLRIQTGDFDLALNDLNHIVRLRPDLARARLLRSIVFAQQGRHDDAIRDLQRAIRTVQNVPENAKLRREWQFQLASYYVDAKRPSKAIGVYTEILESDPEYWMAYRSRGDAFLSVGKHKEAISDYEAVLQLQPTDEGTLNNLSWVLATSPDDAVRQSDRAIELAKKACEVSEYKAAHIISTLAAAFAEAGDFQSAIEWSTKAVEMDKNLEEQLRAELESYKQNKPWRELQKIEEAPEAEEPNVDDLFSDVEEDPTE